MKGCLCTFQRIVRLYRDSIHRMDEVKDDCPFRHTLAGCELRLSFWISKDVEHRNDWKAWKRCSSFIKEDKNYIETTSIDIRIASKALGIVEKLWRIETPRMK